ncbi:MAG: hypothetical protein R3F10_01110 [Lysobacteraceae bacterium]
MLAVGDVHLAATEQPREHLVHQRRGLQGVVVGVLAQFVRGEHPQFPVHLRQQRIQRADVACVPAMQQLRDLVLGGVHGWRYGRVSLMTRKCGEKSSRAFNLSRQRENSR